MASASFPASIGQESIWIGLQLNPTPGAYHVAHQLRYTGALDRTAFQKSLISVVERHESLRSHFQLIDGKLHQCVEDRAAPELLETRLDDGPEEARLHQADVLLQRENARPFTLERAPLFRVSLFKLSEEEHVVVLVLHHLITDAWSGRIIIRELLYAYSSWKNGSSPSLPPVAGSFRSFVEAEQQLLNSAAGQRQREYWSEKLKGELPRMEFPRPQGDIHPSNTHLSFVFDFALTNELKAFCATEKSTLFIVLLTSFTSVLARYVRSTRTLVVCPTAGRRKSEFEGVVGYFVNPVALLVSHEGRPSFRALLQRVQQTVIEAFSHSEIPFDLVRQTARSHSPGDEHRLDQISFQFRNEPRRQPSQAALTRMPLVYRGRVTPFPLSVSVSEVKGGLQCSFEYDAGKYNSEALRQFSVDFQEALAEGIRSPESPAWRLLSRHREEINRFNQTGWSLPEFTVVELFDQHVRRTPNAVALSDDKERLTYQTLAAKAELLARRLLAHGVKAGDTVGLAAFRSIEFVVAALGILKSGAAYMPVDPELPPRRVETMLRLAAPKYILVGSGVEETLFAREGKNLSVSDLFENHDAAPDASEAARSDYPSVRVMGTSPAYVLFTSGSTGEPKGIANTHRGLLNRILWMQSEYSLTEEDRVLHKTSSSFDVSVWELIWPLVTGARLVLAKPGGQRDPDYLAALIQQEEVTTLHFVPSMLAAFIAQPGASRASSLRRVICSGEVLSRDLALKAHTTLGAEVYNLYGPTEAAIDVTSWHLNKTPASSVPIGRPIWNTRIYLLDNNLQPVPPGVAGELYIAGVGLALGYIGRSGLTAERFVPDPFGEPGTRMYRSGDLACRSTDGVIEYMGRTDDQLKLRGNRIELGEIEAELSRHPAVRQCAVIAAEGTSGELQLAAYIVPRINPDINDFRAFLSARLPDYMVPAAFVLLKELPVSISGKLNKKALPSPKFEQKNHRPARTPQEELLARIFAEVLGVKNVGLDDNFFHLGGHSLLAIKLMSRIRTDFQKDVSLRSVFDHPCVERLSRHLQLCPDPGPKLAPRKDKTAPFPLSYAQRRLWVAYRQEPTSSNYHVVLSLRLRGKVNDRALKEALNDIVERHEILRTRFIEDLGGDPRQVLSDASPIDLPVQSVPSAELEAEAVAEFKRPFLLDRQPPIRARLLVESERDCVLLITLHHLATDGFSQEILNSELAQAYSARLRAEMPTWAPLPLQYGDYTLWERETFGTVDDPFSRVSKNINFWKTTLDNFPGGGSLYGMHSKVEGAAAKAEVFEFEFDPTTCARLQDLAQRGGGTNFMVLQATLAILFFRSGAGDDLAFGIPVSGRGKTELEGLIGFFVHTLVVRIRLGEATCFDDLLRQVRSSYLEAFAHQEVPADTLAEVLRSGLSSARGVLYQAMLVYHRRADVRLEWPELDCCKYPLRAQETKTDLAFIFTEGPGTAASPFSITARIEYNGQLYDRAILDYTIRRFLSLLRFLDGAASLIALPLIDAEERRFLEQLSKGPKVDFPPLSLAGLFEDQVRKTPDSEALRFRDGALTYIELNAEANRLAHYLLRLGIGPNRRVALALSRSPRLIIAIFAVVKTGAAFVPLDPAYPKERLQWMLSEAQPCLVLTETAVSPDWIDSNGVILDSAPVRKALALSPSSTPPDDRHSRDHPAYIIFTSGSTGQPKGVVVTHRGIANLRSAQQMSLAVGPRSRILQFASISFDGAIWEIVCALLQGGTLILAPAESLAGESLSTLLAEYQVTHLTLPPTILATLPATAFPSLRMLVAAGENLPATLAARWTHGRSLLNGYGPTEITVCATLSTPLTSDGPVGLGKPIANTQVFVLDPVLALAPVGLPGEVYLSGLGLADGYWNQPALTAERFVANPFGPPGSRLYRTGDVARWRPDGTLEFVGRTDHQVKINGVRVELGEVEAALNRHPKVKRAVATTRDVEGRKQLIAYVEPLLGESLSVTEIRAHAARYLPPAMVPPAILLVREWPVTPNGKLDRSALPSPERESEDPKKPTSPHLALVCDLVAQTLRRASVRPEDNFFQLGGDSIFSLELVRRARARGLTLHTHDIFRSASLADLAASAVFSVSAEAQDEDPGEVSLTPILRWFQTLSDFKLNFAQHRYLPVPDGCEEEALRQALQGILDRHDALRMQWKDHDSSLAVVERGAVRADECLQVVDKAFSPDVSSTEAYPAQALRRLSLAKGKLLDAVWFRASEGQSTLLLTIHHAAVDAVSWKVIQDDLSSALDRRDPPPRTTSFRRWARLLHEEAENRTHEIPHWMNVLGSPCSFGRGGLERGRDTHETAGRFSRRLPADLSKKLLEFSAQQDAKLHDLILAGLLLALVRHGQHPAPVIDLERHGREDHQFKNVDLSHTVGWFTFTFPCAFDVAASSWERPREVLREVERRLAEVPGRGLGYGLLRYLHEESRARLAALPAPPISFNFIGRQVLEATSDPHRPHGGIRSQADPHLSLSHILELNFTLFETRDQAHLACDWIWARSLLLDDEVNEIYNLWCEALLRLCVEQNHSLSIEETWSERIIHAKARETLEAHFGAIEEILPLSPLQEGFLYHLQTEPDTDPYIVQTVFSIEGALDVPLLRRCAKLLLERHRHLLAAFEPNLLDFPVQILAVERRFPWKFIDLSKKPANQAKREAVARAAAERSQTFVPQNPPLLRWCLIRLGDCEHTLVLTLHHILADGWSMPILLQELNTLYSSRGDQAALPVVTPYHRYLAWLNRQDKAAGLRIWKDYLGDLKQPTLLRAPDASPPVYGDYTTNISPAVIDSLVAMAAAEQVTVNSVIQLAWGLLLAQTTRHDDVVFGITVSGRPEELPDSERMVGLFINTLPLRIRLNPREDIGSHCRRLMAEQGAVTSHHYVNLAELQSLAGFRTLFDTTVVYENYPKTRAGNSRKLLNFRVDKEYIGDLTHYTLGAAVLPFAEGWKLRFSYRSDRLERNAVELVARRFLAILGSVSLRPRARLWELSGMDREETEQLLAYGRGEHSGEVRTAVEIFAATVERAGRSVALVCGDKELSYEELDTRANQLAHELIARGVKAETLVALAVPRSIEMVVALLGVMKTGGAYLPLDLGHPPERMRRILSDARPRIILMTRASQSLVPPVDTEILVLDDETVWARLRQRPPILPSRKIHPQQPAYVIYTSGSTGEPKAVVVPHAGIVSLAAAQAELFDVQRSSRVLQHASISFDVALSEIALAFYTGAALVLIKEEQRLGRPLAEVVRSQKVTHATWSPGVLGTLEEELPLQSLWIGGEACPPELVERWSRRLKLINVYGPTEGTVCATMSAPLQGAVAPPIGGPVPNAQVYVLDHYLKLVPVGATGELYLAGPGLARGYRGRPAQTAERFVAHPFGAPGERLYRTGDLVRWNAQGVLEFLGRADEQVKIRGFRVELGEIEAVLRSQPGVAQAVALVREDVPGEKRLVAYLIAAPAQAIDPAVLRSAVAEVLPDYMIPSAWVFLDQWPLSPHGKLDRHALPAPPPPPASRPPRTPHEEILCALFADLLHLPSVGIDDHFFALGGHSLLATRLVNKIQRYLSIDISIRSVFEKPTVASLAGHLRHDQIEPWRPLPRTDPLPLSFAQQRLWFIQQMEGAAAVYHIPFCLKWGATLNPDALALALHDVVRRHEILRTVYPSRNGIPHQSILPMESVQLTLSVEKTEEANLAEIIEGELRKPFLLAEEIPLRARLFSAGSEFRLVLVIHHIATDGWSQMIFSRDLGTAYRARFEGKAPRWASAPLQYADYAIAEAARWSEDKPQESRMYPTIEYWKRQLADLPEPIEWPFARPRPRTVSFAGEAVSFNLDADLQRRLQGIAQRVNASVFMTVQAGLAAYLCRVGCGNDLIFGSPIAGQRDAHWEDAMGLFANTLVLRTPVSGSLTFLELVGRVREKNLEAYTHQAMPFDRLVQLLNPTRSLSQHPLFQVMLVYQAASEKFVGMEETDASMVDLDVAVAKFDLTFSFRERRGADGLGKGIAGKLEYRTDLFGADEMEPFCNRFIHFLKSIAIRPEGAIADPKILLPQEEGFLYSLGRGTEFFASRSNLVEVFDSTVERAGRSVALVCGDEELSYEELDTRANQLAHELIARGVKAETLVALAVPRSIEMVVALLGVMKAGGAYLPLDLGHPPERMRRILSDARPRIILMTRASQSLVPPVDTEILVLNDETVLSRLRQRPPILPSRKIHPQQPAYVIYTSGSTGEPKAVVVPHAGIVSLAAAQAELFDVQRSSRVLQHASISFDVALSEIALAFYTGAALVLIKEDQRLGRPLAEVVRSQKVTHATWSPGVLGTLEEELPLQSLWIGGEACPPELVERWSRRLKLINVYGPTEGTVCATMSAPLHGAVAPPIGRPVPNTQVYVLDHYLKLVPVGATGELYLAGPNLARGYLGRPAQTAERFVAHPFGAPGERLYRTGDLVRWNAEGVLEFLGRADEQVKIRGFRVELGEIEAVLRSQPGVAQAVALVREDVPGEKRLVAYLIAAPAQAIDPAVLRSAVAEVLPDYMIPSAWVFLDQWPLSPHGKLDRHALPAPPPPPASRPPRTPHEEILCALFADLLHLPSVGIDDHFFALGGHSLLATRLVNKIRDALHTELPVRTVFEKPTPAGLVDHLGPASSRPPLFRVQPRPERIPLSLTQRGLWFVEKMERGSVPYHIPLLLRLDRNVDLTALEAALGDVIARHEALRTVLAEDRGEPFQCILPVEQARCELARFEVSALEIGAHLRGSIRQPFHLDREIPIRASLYPGENPLLLIVIHHLASDGWSQRILDRDLSSAYRARIQGRAPQWPSGGLQYADFTLWQRSDLGEENDSQSRMYRQFEFWRQQLLDLPDDLGLPLDYPRPARPSTRAAALDYEIPPDLQEKIVAMARSSGCTPFMVIQAALAVVFSRLTGKHEMVFGCPTSGRTDTKLEDVVGFFVTTLVLRANTAGNPCFGEVVQRVKKTNLEAFAHQDAPFDRLVELLCPHRTLARHPLFQTTLVYQNLGPMSPQPEGLPAQWERLDDAVAKIDLTLAFSERPTKNRGLNARVEYNADLYKPTTIEKLIGQFLVLLKSACASPESRLSELSGMDQEETEQLLAYGRGEHSGEARIVVEVFASTVERAGRSVALVCGDEELSYEELDTRANQLAHELIARGVRAETLVALAVPRSIEMIVALLGVMKAGGAYLPLDLAHPPERMRRILSDARPRIILVTRASQSLVPPVDTEIFVLDDETVLARLRQRPPILPSRKIHPQQPAYVIYTSGSTGEPKAVVVPHAGIASLAAAQAVQCDVQHSSRVLQYASISFDVAISEIALAFYTGAALVLIKEEQRLGRPLAEVVRSQKVTHAMWTPGVLSSLEEELPLQSLWIGGEACPPELVERWSRRLKLINVYGPTEGTVCATMSAPLQGAVAPPIGRPVPNAQVYVLDHYLKLVPVGATGELYLAGPNLARGYLGRPAQTAERFIAHPFGAPGERLYRTGDLVRWNAQGVLEFLGRVDEQVKIRGFRVELGEIEAVLRRQPGVAQTVALVREDVPGEKRLVAYLIAAPAQAIDPAVLRSAVAEVLPDYMVPSAWVFLDQWPLSPHGKLDRHALPAPPPPPASRPPRTPHEEILCTLFADLLHLPSVGIDDHFFALGGHSLLATRLVNKIRDALHTELPVRTVFEKPTPAGLARSIQECCGPLLSPVLPIRASGDGVPIFCVPPIEGLAWCYQTLNSVIPTEHPIYGLQFGTEPLPATLEEFIDQLILEIVRWRRDRPIILMGYSLGAVLAHQIALELKHRDVLVDLLVLLDPPPLRDGRVDHVRWDEGLLRDKVEALPLKEEEKRQTLYSACQYFQLCASRDLSSYEGETLLFVSRSPAESSKIRSWQNVSAASLRVVPLECSHHELLTPPHLITIGNHFTPTSTHSSS